MTAKLPKLSHLLKYHNQDVINRYMKDYGKSRIFAERMFTEMLKYLWISKKSAYSGANVRIPMYENMLCIDWMWHTFILFTKEYTEFSNHYFGGYVHHAPATKPVRGHQADTEKEFMQFTDYVYDHLGPKTLHYWFKPAHARMMRKKIS